MKLIEDTVGHGTVCLIMFKYTCFQEFYDEWPIKLGEVEPYKGPKTPDGRVSANTFPSDMCACTRCQNQQKGKGTGPRSPGF